MQVYLEHEVLGNPTMFIPHLDHVLRDKEAMFPPRVNESYKTISPEVPTKNDKDILVKFPIFPDNSKAYERYFKTGIKSKGKWETRPISPHFRDLMKTNKIRKIDVRGKNRKNLEMITVGLWELNLIRFSTILRDHLKQEEYGEFEDYRNQLTELLVEYGHLYETLMENSEPITPKGKRYTFNFPKDSKK